MSRADGNPIDIASEKLRLLIAILALAPGQRASRSELMSVLWGDRGADQARGSLRHALWAIRKEMGELSDDVLESSGQQLCLRNASTDVAEFKAALAEHSASELEAALALYRGDLLDDCDLGGHEGYEALLIERERLREAAVAAAKDLVKLRRAGSDTGGAIAAAQWALAIDPLQEDAHRSLIEIYRDSGQTGLAIKQFGICREVLAELGVAPAAETEALRRSLNAPAPRQPAVPATPVPEAAATSQPAGRATRRSWALPAAAGLAALILFVGLVLTGIAQPPVRKPHIAVLPFEDMSVDQQQELYSEGLTADIITDLAKLSGVEVIARDSVRAIAATDASILDIAEALSVDYVLRGNMRRSRGLLRINVQLIDAYTGQHVWAERFDRDTADLFEVQDEVVRQVTAALAVDVTETERAAVARIPTDNLEAYDHFLRAEHLTVDVAGTESRRAKLTAYQKAIALDPEFADAHAGYARTLVDVWRFDLTDLMSATVAKNEAYEAANTALRLDPQSARALTVLAMIQLSEGQHGVAAASARNAAAIEPGNAEVQADLALVLALSGQTEAAREALAVSHELNPALPPDLLVTSGIVAFEEGQYDEAVQYLERALEKVPTKEWANSVALSAYGHLGDEFAAARIRPRLLEAFPIANLSYYEVAQDQIRTPVTSARYVEGLALAGLPKWPYGVDPGEASRITGPKLDGLVFGRTWIGAHHSGTPFIQENGQSGQFAYRSDLSLRTGSITVEEGQVCETSDGNLPSGKSCGELHALVRDDADYVLLMPESVRYFRAAE